MTICVAVKVQDCLVFAADSTTTLTQAHDNGAQQFVNVYHHANKIYNLHRHLPICAMTCGLGNIGSSSISTLAKDIRLKLHEELDEKNYTIYNVAEIARKYLFDERYLKLPNKPQGEHSLEFYVGGYGSDTEMSEVWRVTIANGGARAVECMAGPEEPASLIWSGQPEAINRLILGYGQEVPLALAAAGAAQEVIEQVLARVARSPQSSILSAAMPVQDAIRLADFLIDVTKGYVRFLPGVETVGGDTDVCTVTKHEGFKWVRRKHYYPASLNPRGIDHVGE